MTLTFHCYIYLGFGSGRTCLFCVMLQQFECECHQSHELIASHAYDILKRCDAWLGLQRWKGDRLAQPSTQLLSYTAILQPARLYVVRRLEVYSILKWQEHQAHHWLLCNVIFTFADWNSLLSNLILNGRWCCFLTTLSLILPSIDIVFWVQSE